MNRTEILTEFLVKKNYQKLKENLKESKSVQDLDILAKIYIEEKNYKEAGKIYSKIGYDFEFGRCELLRGNIENAKQIWKQIKNETSATLWGKSLIQFIELYVTDVPTFFQIRAFLEVDIDALLKANLITYCENLVSGTHLLARNNQESFKFVGRAFFNNNYYEIAETFLIRAKDICYIDPEVHFMLAKCYLMKQNTQEAIKSLNTCLEKGYGYYPAKMLLEEITKN